MAKPRIDLDPQGPITFVRKVKIPTPDGKPFEIAFTFKYRTRDEMAARGEAILAKRRPQWEAEAELALEQKNAIEAAAAAGVVYIPPTQNLQNVVDQSLANEIEVVMDDATAWVFQEYEFTAENLRKLFTRYQGAYAAITKDYLTSMSEGYLGN